MMNKIIAPLVLSVFFSTSSFAFWNTDNTDYSLVEDMFTASKSGNISPSPLFKYEGNKFCKGGQLYTTKYTKLNATPKGGDHTSGNGKLKSSFFAVGFNHAIATYLEAEYDESKAYQKDDFLNEYVPYLVNAAKERYFTVNRWVKGGSSVAYAQTMVLINLSIFMDFMDHRGLWKAGQREEIVKWGDVLYKHSHYSHHANGGRKQRHRWPDTVSKAAAAYMLWGYVTHDIKIFKDGYKDLLQEYKKIPEDGKYHQHYKGPLAGVIMDNWDLFLENKTLGDLVIASYVGELVGLPTFDKPNKKGGTIKKAIEYLGEVSSNPATLRGQDERHLHNMRIDGNSWMTVYRLMDTSDTNPLVDLHLISSEKKGYGYQQILNYSRCLANEVN
ncbi:MAG: hypothetical protein HRU04_03480 [Oceanospirillaceae bacterium]|nr:hypothetical protein [Oceanospirillaceae bacterium]